jgi:hypothetical protein
MNIEKVVFAFFILSALTLNFGFFVGNIGDSAHHHPYELFAALVASLIATILKFGDRSQLGAVLLASSLVADLQLLTAVSIWAYAGTISGTGMDNAVMSSIVSLSGGALVANIVSVILLIFETTLFRR